jgi:non-specific serine/threonine protein kinase/serine/threonine-protein kinase
VTSADSGSDFDIATRWKRIEDLFHRAMEVDADVRAAMVAEWCAGDAGLEQELQALLEADNRVENLISTGSKSEPEESIPNRFLLRSSKTRTGMIQESAEEVEDDQWIGRMLGAFRLERLLGRGGMGVVYLGRRVSGGLAQQVAIKLVGRHLRSSPVVQQFLLERETLARLEHPHIARLIDGGVTVEGFPYVAMEFVEGRRLDAACDDPATSIDQIIRWMLQLCDAVSYVHRNLILHRDLKPGNVMVTDEGSVKLLDFGTLKRIGPESQTDSAMTQAGMRAVTLRYASPEHIQGDRISTAADVFSLGMILYRLIAGGLPERMNHMPIGVYLEFLREGQIAPPSHAAAQSSVARKIDIHVSRDLDAIVAKALRFEPEARYPTAGALAEDLWNLLTHRPVSARDGSLRYRADKFYLRFRWPIRAAVAAILVLTIGLSVMAWQGHVARREEARAEKGVEDERQLAHMLLFDYFDQLRQIPGSIDAERKAVTRALAYLDALAAIAPGSDLELDTIGGYTDMGSLLGDPYEQNLGDVPGALRALNKAVAVAESRAAKHPHDLASMQMLANAEMAIGGTYMGNGDAIQAEKYLQNGADTVAAMAKDSKVTADMLQLAASLTDLLGDVYDPGRGYSTADLSKSMQTYLLSDEYDEQCRKIEPKNAACNAGVVVGDYKLGLLMETTDPAFSATRYRHGLNVVNQYPSELSKTTRALRGKNYMLSRLGLMEMTLGQTEEGMKLSRQAQAGFREAIARAELDNRARFDLVAFETDLSEEYDRVGKDQEAAETAHEVLGVLSVLLQRSPRNVRWQMIQANDLRTSGRAETKLGHKREGAIASKKGLDQLVNLAENKDATPEALSSAADALIELHLHPGDEKIAVSFAERAVKAFTKPTPELLLTLAKAQSASGQSQEAAKTARLALAALTGPVKSKIVADEIADARRLVK